MLKCMSQKSKLREWVYTIQTYFLCNSILVSFHFQFAIGKMCFPIYDFMMGIFLLTFAGCRSVRLEHNVNLIYEES